jgi:hypothetical protein
MCKSSNESSKSVDISVNGVSTSDAELDGRCLGLEDPNSEWSVDGVPSSDAELDRECPRLEEPESE